MTRPLCFGTGTAQVTDADDFIEFAQWAETAGFDVLLIPDHLGAVSPEVAMTAVAQATTTIKVGSFVFNNDFRHPVILAQQAAALDMFSNGRLELGLGAGWNEPEYTAMGWTIDRPSVRIARMEEAAVILKQLFAGEPVTFDGEHYQIVDHTVNPIPPQGSGLPLHIGGNGDKLLAAAARTADIVGLTGFSAIKSTPNLTHFDADGAADRIEHVRQNAGDRFGDIEFGALIQRVIVTGDREEAAAGVVSDAEEAGYPVIPTANQLLDSPFSLFGTHDEMKAQITRYRDQLGITYFTVFRQFAADFAPVVADLAGT